MNFSSHARYFGILNRQLQAYINLAFKSSDLGYWEIILLTNLYDNEGINQEQLSSILYIDKSVTAKTIKSLVNKGFIIRKACEKDKRAKKLYLTDKGRKSKNEIFDLIEKWISYIFDGIDSNSQNFVIKELQHMAENAKKVDYDELLKK